MKNKLLLLVILFAGLNGFAQKKPFATINEVGYSTPEAFDSIKGKPILLAAYQKVFQDIGERDGWIENFPNKKITLDNTKFLLNSLDDTVAVWLKGEARVALIENGVVSYFDRPSWSDRRNKKPGAEPVGVLDIAVIYGWKDQNGNSFPRRVVMGRRCVNSIIDLRVFESNKLVKNSTKNTETKDDSLHVRKHETKNEFKKTTAPIADATDSKNNSFKYNIIYDTTFTLKVYMSDTIYVGKTASERREDQKRDREYEKKAREEDDLASYENEQENSNPNQRKMGYTKKNVYTAGSGVWSTGGCNQSYNQGYMNQNSMNGSYGYGHTMQVVYVKKAHYSGGSNKGGCNKPYSTGRRK